MHSNLLRVISIARQSNQGYIDCTAISLSSVSGMSFTMVSSTCPWNSRFTGADPICQDSQARMDVKSLPVLISFWSFHPGQLGSPPVSHPLSGHQTGGQLRLPGTKEAFWAISLKRPSANQHRVASRHRCNSDCRAEYRRRRWISSSWVGMKRRGGRCLQKLGVSIGACLF